jgi:Domain of unknown function (DUF4399)
MGAVSSTKPQFARVQQPQKEIMKVVSAMPAIVIASLLAACGGDTGSANTSADTATMHAATMATDRSVRITSPSEGDTVQGPNVSVSVAASGFTVVAAGDSTPNSGHLHLFLDRDLSAPGAPIPVEPGFIMHLGTGATDYTIENVAPGEHRLIVAVGDAVHIPLQPWVVDTVNFVVH